MQLNQNILLQQFRQDLKLRGVKNYHLDFLVAENPSKIKVSANEMIYLYYFGVQSNGFKVNVSSELSGVIYHPENCRKLTSDFFESHHVTKHLSTISFQSEGAFFIHYLRIKLLPNEED